MFLVARLSVSVKNKSIGVIGVNQNFTIRFPARTFAISCRSLSWHMPAPAILMTVAIVLRFVSGMPWTEVVCLYHHALGCNYRHHAQAHNGKVPLAQFAPAAAMRVSTGLQVPQTLNS